MPVEEISVPICTHADEKEDPPCGLPMFRIGTQAVFGWVCEKCDKADRSRALDKQPANG